MKLSIVFTLLVLTVAIVACNTVDESLNLGFWLGVLHALTALIRIGMHLHDSALPIVADNAGLMYGFGWLMGLIVHFAFIVSLYVRYKTNQVNSH